MCSYAGYSAVVISWCSAVLTAMCNVVVPLGCAIDVGFFFFSFNLIAKKCNKRFLLIAYTCLPPIFRQNLFSLK